MKFNLNGPYPINKSIKKELITSSLFGGFVFLFLLIFKPFEIGRINQSIVWVALGYGFITFTLICFINIILPMIFPRFFSEENWTTLKEIFKIGLTIFFIGLVNYIYSSLLGFVSFNSSSFFLFLSYTIAIGIFPVSIGVFINQNRLIHKFEKKSQQINTQIENNYSQEETRESSLIQLSNGSEVLELKPSDFCFAKANDNYVEIYFLTENRLERKVLRNTLKSILDAFSDSTSIVKCHRSYIVNLNHIEKVSGNAQGYKLHFNLTQQIIPVSRSLNQFIQGYFDQK